MAAFVVLSIHQGGSAPRSCDTSPAPPPASPRRAQPPRASYALRAAEACLAAGRPAVVDLGGAPHSNMFIGAGYVHLFEKASRRSEGAALAESSLVSKSTTPLAVPLSRDMDDGGKQHAVVSASADADGCSVA